MPTFNWSAITFPLRHPAVLSSTFFQASARRLRALYPNRNDRKLKKRRYHTRGSGIPSITLPCGTPLEPLAQPRVLRTRAVFPGWGCPRRPLGPKRRTKVRMAVEDTLTESGAGRMVPSADPALLPECA